MPSGTPASPPTRKGHTSLKSIERQIEGMVQVWAMMEQITTS